jgi:hypothetical protein
VVEPALFPGKTGEFCFVGPPIAVGLARPPTALCAKAGSEKPLPHKPRKTPINTARIAAPLFIACPFHLSASNEDFRIIHHTLTCNAEFGTAARAAPHAGLRNRPWIRRRHRTGPSDPAGETRTSGLRRLGKGLSPKPVPISLAGSARPVSSLSASGSNLALRGGPDGRLACEPFYDFRHPGSEPGCWSRSPLSRSRSFLHGYQIAIRRRPASCRAAQKRERIR